MGWNKLDSKMPKLRNKTKIIFVFSCFLLVSCNVKESGRNEVANIENSTESMEYLETYSTVFPCAEYPPNYNLTIKQISRLSDEDLPMNEESFGECPIDPMYKEKALITNRNLLREIVKRGHSDSNISLSLNLYFGLPSYTNIENIGKKSDYSPTETDREEAISLMRQSIPGWGSVATRYLEIMEASEKEIASNKNK